MKNYGQVIAKLRKKHGLTQEQLGKKLNVTYQAISKWENNLSEPDLATIEKIVEIFNIDIGEFFSMANNNENDKPIIENKKEIINTKENIIKEKPWYIVIGLSIAIFILFLCALLIPRTYNASQIYKMVDESVFCITVEGPNAKQAGTGFFINNTGLAVTNYHVIENTTKGKIKLNNGRSYGIKKIVGASKEKDIAIIQVNINKSKSVRIGDSNKINVGDTVYAIGYPESFVLGSNESTLTQGIISKTSYNIEGNNYIQTTVDITHGNSGGVLVNTRGQVIGITTLAITDGTIDYMNMAIPINKINTIKRNVNMSLSEFFEYGKPHRVNFIANGSVYQSQSVQYKKQASPIDCNITGYIFEGWYINTDYTINFDFATRITKNTDVYAKLIPIKTTVKFELDGGYANQHVQDVQMEFNETIDFLIPEKPGHEFVGWLDSDSNIYTNGDKWNKVEDTSLTASWKVATYNITYILNGGTNGENPSSYTYFDEDFRLKDPTKTGHDFLGWYLDENYTTKVNAICKYREGNITLYAKFELSTYTIKFSMDYDSEIENNTLIVKYGDKIILPKPTKDREGYTFSNWKYYIKNQVYQNLENTEFTWTITEDVYLYPVWEPKTYKIAINDYITGNKIRVAFISEGKLVETGEITQSNALKYPKHIPFKEGYLFTGWYIDKECTQLFDFSSYLENDINLYAGFIYNNNLPTHDFNNNYLPLEDGKTTVEKFFYGLENMEMTISIIGNNTSYGYSLEIHDITQNMMLGKVTMNCETYYRCSDTYVTKKINFNVTKDHIYKIYAISESMVVHSEKAWKIEETFYYPIISTQKIHLDDNGPLIKEVTFDSNFTLPSPYIYYGDSLRYYYYNENNEKVYLTNSDGESLKKYDIPKDITVYLDNVSSKITYVLNGGINNENNKTKFDDFEIVTLYAPTQEHYEFLGWYENRDFIGEPVNFVSGYSKTLYARWKGLEGFKIDAYQNYATITQYTGTAEILYIPKYYNGVEITHIGVGAFDKNTTIKELHIPETIEEIPAPYYTYDVEFPLGIRVYIDSKYIIDDILKTSATWWNNICGGMLVAANEIYLLSSYPQSLQDNLAANKFSFTETIEKDGKLYHKFVKQ